MTPPAVAGLPLAKQAPSRRVAVPVATGTALVVFVVIAVFAAGVAVADPSSEVPAEQALRAAGRAVETTSFLGILQMHWTDGGQPRSESLGVEAAGGSVVVRGEAAAMASPSQRLVQHDGEWDLLWPVPLGGPERPSPAVKYQVSTAGLATVAGRPTQVVEFRDDGVLLERLFLDLDTHLLLRREQFEGGATVSRSIGFEAVTIGSANVAPRVPKKIVNAAASPVAGGHLPAGVSASANLPDSYQRLGIYRRSGVTQVLYSDGLYDLSVFEEEGRLDRSQLPKGEKVQIGGRTGFHYVWAGGHVVVWEARGVVHTAVSDAPVAQILTAVQSIPVTGGSASLLRRLRQVCRALVQPLS